MTLDCFLGVLIAYGIFKIVESIVEKNNIDILRSGLYVSKNVSLIDGKEVPDDAIDMRIWFVQVVVWVLCTLIAKMFLFFLVLAYHRELAEFGNTVLYSMKDYPKLQLVMVMIVIPVFFNAC